MDKKYLPLNKNKADFKKIMIVYLELSRVY